MTEYRMLGPDECPDWKLGDQRQGVCGGWFTTLRTGVVPAKRAGATSYRRPIKQEEKPVTEFKVGDTVKIVRKVVPDDWSDVWVKEMDEAVGQVGVIDPASYGDRYYLSGIEPGCYCYPKEALELITSNDEPTDEPVVKEPSQVYDWRCGTSAIYGVDEEEALEWFDEQVRRAAEDAVDGETTVTLYRSHTTATIKKTVEISVKSVDGAE